MSNQIPFICATSNLEHSNMTSELPTLEENGWWHKVCFEKVFSSVKKGFYSMFCPINSPTEIFGFE